MSSFSLLWQKYSSLLLFLFIEGGHANIFIGPKEGGHANIFIGPKILSTNKKNGSLPELVLLYILGMYIFGSDMAKWKKKNLERDTAHDNQNPRS